jgi:hypothetical protein
MDRDSTPIRGATAPAREVGDAHAGIVYLGIIHAVDGVRFVTHAASYPDVIDRVAEYVRVRCEAQLAPEESRRVLALLEDRERDVAVELYFAAVGDRWDKESLWVGMSDEGG